VNQRTAIVDILRGWALLAVVLVNFAIFYSFGRVQRIPEGDWPSQAAKILVQVVFQGKGWPALALLFGYGFSAWIAKTCARGADPVPGFIRRMSFLLVLGVVNCAFPLALTMIGLRGSSPAVVARLSAFAQGVGYLIAIPGPILVGLLHDRTGGWRLPLALMVVLMVPQIIAGIAAGRDRRV
jgi:hypothetical protein